MRKNPSSVKKEKQWNMTWFCAKNTVKQEESLLEGGKTYQTSLILSAVFKHFVTSSLLHKHTFPFL